MKKLKSVLMPLLLANLLLLVACSAQPTTEPSKTTDPSATNQMNFSQEQAKAKVDRLLDVHAELVNIAKSDEVAKSVLLVGESCDSLHYEAEVLTKDGVNLKYSYASIALPVNYFFRRVNLGEDNFDLKEYAASVDAEQMLTEHLPSMEEIQKMEKTTSTDLVLCEAIGLVNYMNRDGYALNELKPATEPTVFGSDTAFAMTIDVGTNKEELVAIFNAEGYLLNIVAVDDPNFDAEKYILSF